MVLSPLSLNLRWLMITLYVSILSYKMSKQECESARKRMNIIQRQKGTLTLMLSWG